MACLSLDVGESALEISAAVPSCNCAPLQAFAADPEKLFNSPYCGCLLTEMMPSAVPNAGLCRRPGEVVQQPAGNRYRAHRAGKRAGQQDVLIPSLAVQIALQHKPLVASGALQQPLACTPHPPTHMPPCLLPSPLLNCYAAGTLPQAGAGGGVSASVAADDAAVNRFLLDLVRCVQASIIRRMLGVACGLAMRLHTASCWLSSGAGCTA